MNNTVNEMRNSHQAYKAFVGERDGGNWESHPIMEWFGRKYVVTRDIKLTTDLQRLEVIDVTDIETYKDEKSEECPFTVALFANSWPEQTTRRHALVHHADEGHDSILLENGSHMWVHYADLPIRVIPGTKADTKLVREQQMDGNIQRQSLVPNSK